MWERMNVIFNHLPKKSDVDMILFTASECVEEYNVDQNIQYAWEPYVKSILKISTPGNHETMLEEPSIESLASKLDEYVS
jgi:thioesterase domain-containing protein